MKIVITVTNAWFFNVMFLVECCFKYLVKNAVSARAIDFVGILNVTAFTIIT